LKVNHQLESRMPEIGLFGSGGGASPKRRPYLINIAFRRYAHTPIRRHRSLVVAAPTRYVFCNS
jgi:hypothetical protein